MRKSGAPHNPKFESIIQHDDLAEAILWMWQCALTWVYPNVSGASPKNSCFLWWRQKYVYCEFVGNEMKCIARLRTAIATTFTDRLDSRPGRWHYGWLGLYTCVSSIMFCDGPDWYHSLPQSWLQCARDQSLPLRLKKRLILEYTTRRIAQRSEERITVSEMFWINWSAENPPFKV